MDFVNQQSSHPAPAPENTGHKSVLRSRRNGGKGIRILSVVVLVLTTLIIGLLAIFLAIGGSKGEAGYVDKDKYQAVFLNGGQVYFGKVRSMNSKYITIDNIYYLRVNQQVQPDQQSSADTNAAAQDVSLAKLGCELHGPTDIMVINREQVLFWENLKAEGQVVTAISKYVSENPDGQKCETPAAADTTPATEE
jgi:hypothetical protein